MSLCCMWSGEREVVAHLCELLCLAASLSTTHCLIMWNYESHLIPFLLDFVFPVLKRPLHIGQLWTPRHKSDHIRRLMSRLVIWMRPDRQIYLQGCWKKRERGLAWVRELDQTHRTRKNDPHCATEFEFSVPFTVAPDRFTSPALMSFIHMVSKGNRGDTRTVWAAELEDLWWRESERGNDWETQVLSAPKSRSVANQHLTQKFLCDWKWGLLMFTWVWKYARIFGGWSPWAFFPSVMVRSG